jgi:hypothetical protein
MHEFSLLSHLPILTLSTEKLAESTGNKPKRNRRYKIKLSEILIQYFISKTERDPSKNQDPGFIYLFMTYLATRRMIGRLVNNEMGGMWKKAVVI